MNLFFKAVAVAICFVLLSATADARDQSPRSIADGAAPFVDGSTVLVAHVNLASVDAAAIEATLNDSLKSVKLEKEELAAVSRRPSRVPERNGPVVADLKKVGGKEIYAVVDMQSLSSGKPPHLIVPLDAVGGASRILMQSSISSKPGGLTLRRRRISATPMCRLRRVRGDAVWFYPEGGAPAPGVNFTPQPRPDLAIALKSAGEGPLQIALIPPEAARRFVEAALPRIPQELGGGAVTVLTQGLRRANLGAVFSPQLRLRLLIQAKDAESAQGLSQLADSAMKLVSKQAQSQKDLASISAAMDLLKPQVKGDQLIATLDHGSAAEMALRLQSRFTMAVSRRRVASMTHMRQILLGMMMYANDR